MILNGEYIRSSLPPPGKRPTCSLQLSWLARCAILSKKHLSPHAAQRALREVSSEQTSFGTLLRRYRTAAGFTQEALAARAQISARTIADLERGINRTPRHDTFELLMSALDLTAQQRALFLEAALAVARAMGMTMLGHLARQQQNYALAKARYREGLTLLRAFDSPTYTAWCLEAMPQLSVQKSTMCRPRGYVRRQ